MTEVNFIAESVNVEALKKGFSVTPFCKVTAYNVDIETVIENFDAKEILRHMDADCLLEAIPEKDIINYCHKKGMLP